MRFIIRFANQVLDYASATITSIVTSTVKPVETYVYKTYQGFRLQYLFQVDQLVESLKIVMPYTLVATAIISVPVFYLKYTSDMLVSQILELGMSGLSVYGIYKVSQKYSIRFTCENKLRKSISKLAKFDSQKDHIEGMKEVKNIFSSKLITHKEKADLLMLNYFGASIDPENPFLGFNKDTLLLRKIAKIRNSDFKRSLNCFVISLIQEYLTSEQVYRLLSEKEQQSCHTVRLNVFGTLIYEAQAEVMKDFLSISKLTSDQKFSLLMKASNNSGSGLFVASFLVSMLEQYTVTEIIAKNGDKINQENYYKIVELLIDESKSFTNEQRLTFLTKPDCRGNTPLMCLEGVPKLKEKLLKAIQSCVPMLTYKQENSIPALLPISPAVSSIDSSAGLLNRKKNRSAP